MIAGGTTRRTALRTAAGAGAAAVFAPMRLLEPSIAAAATTRLAECKAESNEAAYADAVVCAEKPLADYNTASEHITKAKQLLRNAKSAAERRRLRKVIDFQTRLRRKALDDMGFCNKAFLSDRAEGDAKCEAAGQPSGETGGGGSGSGGSGGSGGCEPGYILCGDYCCNTAYAFCQGCKGTPICCRIEGNCCPSG